VHLVGFIIRICKEFDCTCYNILLVDPGGGGGCEDNIRIGNKGTSCEDECEEDSVQCGALV